MGSKRVYVGNPELRAAATELLRLQGFVADPTCADGPSDILHSRNLRAQRAVQDARRILTVAAQARADKLNAEGV